MIQTKTVTINDLIEFHTKAQKACEAYAQSILDEITGRLPSKRDKRLTEHYAQCAEWHRQAVERIQWIIRQASR